MKNENKRLTLLPSQISQRVDHLQNKNRRFKSVKLRLSKKQNTYNDLDFVILSIVKCCLYATSNHLSLMVVELLSTRTMDIVVCPIMLMMPMVMLMFEDEVEANYDVDLRNLTSK